MNTIEPSMSDEAVQSKTGKDWKTWFEIMDAAGGVQMSHKEIVAFLAKEHQVGSWWQQMLTVSYEQARGLRQKHEKPDGYEISRSKTIPVNIEKVYAACNEETQRRIWLPDSSIAIRKQTPMKLIRAAWMDGTSSVGIWFLGKGPEKTQVTIQHSRLADARQAEAMKTYWSEALDRLSQFMMSE